MITNLIYFLYNIKVDYIRKNLDNYIFFYNNNFYIFKECFFDEKYLNSFYSYINNTYFHDVVRNKNNKLVSNYNNHFYILMRVKFNINRILMIDDILNLKYLSVFNVLKKNFNWSRLWKSKIDQIEYILNNNNFNIHILSIINYYIGLAELSVSVLEKNIDDNEVIPLTICHKRVKCNWDLYEFYSVDNLHFDHFCRDLAEYVKCDIYSSKKIDINKYKSLKKLDKIEKILFLSRILFPTYFFDIFDYFILNKKDFFEFENYFIYFDIYESNLRDLISFIIK